MPTAIAVAFTAVSLSRIHCVRLWIAGVTEVRAETASSVKRVSRGVAAMTRLVNDGASPATAGAAVAADSATAGSTVTREVRSASPRMPSVLNRVARPVCPSADCRNVAVCPVRAWMFCSRPPESAVAAA